LLAIAMPPTRAAETGASAKVADFLLAWWNGDECGHFPILHLCNLDAVIAEDMLTIMAWLAQEPTTYADAWGYRDAMGDLWCAIAAILPRAFKRPEIYRRKEAAMIEDEDEAFADNYAERDQAKALREQGARAAALRGVLTGDMADWLLARVERGHSLIRPRRCSRSSELHRNGAAPRFARRAAAPEAGAREDVKAGRSGPP
jgi:hypothetical protein